MRVLNIPSMTWEAGDVVFRRCVDCGTVSAHIDPLPMRGLVKWVPGYWPDPDGQYATYIPRYSSQSGLTYSEPITLGGYSCCRGYRNHGMVFLTERPPSIIPLELAPVSTGLKLATFRDFFEGVKAEFAVTIKSNTMVPEEFEDYLCAACKIKRIEESEKKLVQGHLVLAPAEVWDGFIPAWNQSQDWDFFNHHPPESEDGYWRHQGRFVVLTVSAEEATIKADDHPPLVVPEGRWAGYHPWPTSHKTD